MRSLPLLLATVLAIGVVPQVEADRETAEFVAQRADKALAARSWAEAETLYRKSLEEDPTLLRARLGLGEALLGAGARTGALVEIRQFLADAEAVTEPPPALTVLAARARRRLAELETLDAQLDQEMDAHAAVLLAFAGRWREKDRDVAVLALQRALLLRPGHAGAQALLETLQAKAPPAVTALFNGKDASGWTWLEPPMWEVRDGVLAAKAVGTQYLCRTSTLVRGDFDIRMEARFVQQWGPTPAFLLCPLLKQESDTSRFGILLSNLVWHEVVAGAEPAVYGAAPAASLDPALDITAWNVYELRYRKDEISAFVNHREIFRRPRPAGRDEGYVGLHVECCAVEFRRIELVQR